MVTRITFVAVAIVAGVVVPVSSSHDFPRQGPATRQDGALSGQVVERGSGHPIAHALVELDSLDSSAGGRRLMTTDRLGRFVFLGLPSSDNYFLAASAFGYASARYRNPRATDQMRPAPPELIALSAGQWIDGLTFPLAKLGSIEGRVSDERGEPLVRVTVRAVVKSWVAGHLQPVAGAVAVTDDRGKYRLSDLADGEYFVTVPSVQSTVPGSVPDASERWAIGQLDTGGYAPGNGASVQWPALQVDSSHRLVLSNFPMPPTVVGATYETVWYPAVKSFLDANAVRIRDGQMQSGIDLSLHPVTSATLTGRVNPVPEGPLLLRLVPSGLEDLGFGFEAATTVTEATGHFLFWNVPAGDYTLIAQSNVSELTKGLGNFRVADSPGYPAGGIGVGYFPAADVGFIRRDGQSGSLAGRMTVRVTAENKADLVLNLRRTGSIHGRVVFEEATSASRQAPIVTVVAEPANGKIGLGYFSVLSEAGSGSFTIPGLLPTRYLLSIGSSLTVSSITCRGALVTNNVLDISETDGCDDILITVTSKLTEVSGRVSGLAGKPAVVLAFPADSALWVDYGFSPKNLRTVTTTTTGAYQIRGLPIGRYYLAALPLDQINAWRDPSFLKLVSSQSVAVGLELGTPVVQGLELVRR